MRTSFGNPTEVMQSGKCPNLNFWQMDAPFVIETSTKHEKLCKVILTVTLLELLVTESPETSVTASRVVQIHPTVIQKFVASKLESFSSLGYRDCETKIMQPGVNNLQ